MCGGYGNEDSNNDGDVTLADFFRDITDGGGAGYSGARFGGGTGSNVLDVNNDRYVSEAEYQRGQSNAESNADRGITGEIGDAYNNSQNIISRGSNIFGALPRGSIRQEAALGSDGRDISTSGAARFMQGFAGDARDMAMAPVRAYRGEGAPPDPVGTPKQQARSFDSIFNKGSSDFNNLPEAQRRAIVQGTRSLNPRLGQPMAMPANVPVPTVLDNYFDYNTSEKDDYIVRDNGDGTYYVKYPNGAEAIHDLTQITNLGLTPT